MRYYTLLARESVTEPWGIQFGDYDKEVVEDEKFDQSESWPHLKIISSKDDQASIDAKVAELNAKPGEVQPKPVEECQHTGEAAMDRWFPDAHAEEQMSINRNSDYPPPEANEDDELEHAVLHNDDDDFDSIPF